MKSLGHQRGGGNFNLRGRKYVKMGCGCCAMIDKRELIHEREVRRELNRMAGLPLTYGKWAHQGRVET